MEPIEDLLKKLLLSLEASQKQKESVEKAFRFAQNAHQGQKRLTGEDYFYHCINTAFILAGWKMDTDSVIAGLLHDTIEDAGVTPETLSKEFGTRVSRIVQGVSKVSHIRLRGSEDETFVENLRKMFLAMAKDLRVVLVKLADRLHNMRTLEGLPEVKQKRIARETLEVYAPLAERLGIGSVKAELEDLGFKYAYPQEYNKLVSESKVYYLKTEDVIQKMRRKLLTKLDIEGIEPIIETRKKHYYSLWKKIQREDIEGDLSKIHDIVAMRVIVDEVKECYVALGVIHSQYTPVPYLGVSDFIAQPKPNGYKSIHTKVFGPNGKIVEVQIRTHQMHEEAERGVAAHWAYSEAKSKGISSTILETMGIVSPGNKMKWVNQLVSWQNEIKDSKEYLSAVKFDALSERIYVFSPKSDVYDLPKGATPVDFAYAVHTKLGNFIKGAKVNGKMVPLNYQLKSGEIVEIVKSKNPINPPYKWMEFVKTTAAKREIKKIH